MTISEMRRLLDERGLQLTRSLGQNFLHDGNQLRRIVAAAELARGDQVLEIGPGLGPLTEMLVASGCPVTAIEMDRRLVAILERRFGVSSVEASTRSLSLLTSAASEVRPHPNPLPQGEGIARLEKATSQAQLTRTDLEESEAESAIGGVVGSNGFLPLPRGEGRGKGEPAGEPNRRAASLDAAIPHSELRTPQPLRLLHADALVWLKKNPCNWAGWKLVANLPYSVGSPILVELAETDQPPDRLVVTLQLEVVKRLLAKADTEDYGLLTLLIQLRYQPAGWFKIPANCFFPQPNVDSACIALIRRPAPLLSIDEATRFTRLVKIAFGQRRKMMFKLLTAAWPEAQLEAAFGVTGIAKTERAERVALDQFVALTRQLPPG